MANRIKGITVEIGGDTAKISKALEVVNKRIKNTQTQLKDVEQLMKSVPGNTELLSQKQCLLALVHDHNFLSDSEPQLLPNKFTPLFF